MNRREIALTLTALGAAACLTLTGCGGGHDTHASPSSPSAATGAEASKQGDVRFAQMMIPHHRQAVEMSDLALDRTHQAGTDVTKLATQIKAAQGPEIQQLQGWLSEWGAPATADAHAGHSMDGMMTEEQMTALGKATGADFDKQWLTMMIAHHEGAVTMSQDVLTTTQNAEVKTMAESIIKGQEQEIDEMKKLLGQ